ncbi:MAG: tetraacyldisaccharide 4'-kinase [Planctomycetota bacterium]
MPDRGPLPPLLARTIGPLAEAIYKAEATRRSQRFDAGIGVLSLDRPVISVGNLSVGGTGKTPLVAAICRWLIEAERRPVIAMRGYKATDAHGSDEADEYARTLPGVPVVANPARHAGLVAFFETAEGRRVDTIVLDDGFQHRKLARDLDIVLIDAGRDPFADRCLPMGWLREPVESLSRAHAVVLTHAELCESEQLESLRDRSDAIGVTEHAWTGLRVNDSEGESAMSPEWLAGRHVVAACGIGRAEGFRRCAERVIGGPLCGWFERPDHDPFRPATVRALRGLLKETKAEALLVTEKDWSKLRHEPVETWGCPVVRPVLQLRWRAGEEALRERVLRTARANP